MDLACIKNKTHSRPAFRFDLKAVWDFWTKNNAFDVAFGLDSLVIKQIFRDACYFKFLQRNFCDFAEEMQF